MTVQQSVDAAGCLRCGAVVGAQCRIVGPDGKTRTGVHYTRWTLALGLNHDPGDEDRNAPQ